MVVGKLSYSLLSLNAFAGLPWLLFVFLAAVTQLLPRLVRPRCAGRQDTTAAP